MITVGLQCYIGNPGMIDNFIVGKRIIVTNEYGNTNYNYVQWITDNDYWKSRTFKLVGLIIKKVWHER